MFGTGQTMFTLGALILVSLLVLNINRSFSNSDISLSQNRYRLEAYSLLNSQIELATQQFFDEASTDTLTGKTLADFTTPGTLGFENPGDASVIDDFDDYHNTTVIDTGISGVIYKIEFSVDYVDLVNGQIVTNMMNTTYHKRMTAKLTDNHATPVLYRAVGSQQIRDTLETSFVYSYWFFN